MYIAIISKQDSKAIMTYQADAPNQASFGGLYGWPESTVHVGMPDELSSLADYRGFIDPALLTAVNADGEWILSKSEQA